MSRILVLALIPVLAAAAVEDDPAPAPRLLDQALAGKILSLEKDVIEVKYDFEDEGQLEDWVKFKPYDAAGELEVALEGGRLRLKGTGAVHHSVTWLDTVSFDCRIAPSRGQDLGGVVSEDAAETEQYVLYCIGDLYFQRWDGGTRPGHMICRFGINDPSEPADRKAFRYIARGTKPDVVGHQTIRFAFGKDEREHTMVIGDQEYKGKGMGREFDQVHAGLYLIKANAVVDDVVLKGRVSPRWLKAANVKLEVSAPIEDAGPSPEELAAQAKLRRFNAGALEGADLLPVLEDAKVTEETREAMADALAASGETKLVTQTISLLYSEDLLTRKLGILVIKGLTRKSFGYDPKADSDKRSKAIKKLIEHIQKDPGKYGG